MLHQRGFELSEIYLQSFFYIQTYSFMRTCIFYNTLFQEVVWWFRKIKDPEQADL